MSDLGAYQTMTVWTKKVGGPISLGMIFVGTGCVIGNVCNTGIRHVIKKMKGLRQKERGVKKEFDVYGIYSSEDGLELSFGDKFEVLDQDGEAVLIKKVGDFNNPYIVPSEIIKQLSDFDKEDSVI